jgi:predicted hydrolase (HD superfamily)
MCLILRSTIKKDKKYVTAYTGEDELLKKYNKEEFHIRHALTVEAVMRYFAKQKGYDEDFWGIVRFIA